MGKIVHVIKKLDLAAIEELADIPVRTLRYVIDHKLVVGLRVERRGVGNARFLSLFDATLLCAATALLRSGHLRSRVRQMMSQYRGATRTRYPRSFWIGLKRGASNWNFATSYVQVSLDVGAIHSMLKGDCYESET